MSTSPKKKPTLGQAIFPILFMILVLAIGYGYFGLKTEPLLILSAFAAGSLALMLGYSWKDMEEAIIDKIKTSMPAILILLSVGFLIGSWMFSGTVPMIIYYGVEIVNPQYLLVSAFLITALISTVTGTSWGAAGTIGVAIMGIAGGLGVSLPATAGAIVAGAYFGDKMSPLSDTTNLAPMIAGSELYEHIKHMLYTTIPAGCVAIAIYLIVGFNTGAEGTDPETVAIMRSQLDSMYHWNILLLIPVLIIVVSSIKKIPAVPAMLFSSFVSLVLGVLIQGFSVKNGFISLIGGFNVSMTGTHSDIIWEVTRLINRGGVTSVTGTIVLIFCAMGFAGILTVTGALDTVLNVILKKVRSTSGIILSTIASCFTMAFVTGNSYLSIIIPGGLFRDTYIKRGLHPKNLSRTLEDSGTVLVPLIPWSAAGAYMAATLGVPTLEYAPWAVLNYAGICFAIFFATTGIAVTKLSKEEQQKYMTELNISEDKKNV